MTTTDAADLRCLELVRHYENFTVASRLAPRGIRQALVRVYAFCRTTDDIGDAGQDTDATVERLTRWRADVAGMFAGRPPVHPVLVALDRTVRRHGLDAAPFLALVDANLQDQRVTGYEDWPALRAYCEMSAAPVGRIVLRLFGIEGARAISLSDDVCIGLQLANFAQDVSVDATIGRTYLLQSDIRAHGMHGATRLMCNRARALLASGRELETMTQGRLRFQLTLYRKGGEAILDAIANANHATEHHRPVVTRPAKLRVLAASLAAAATGRGWLRGGRRRAAADRTQSEPHA